LESFRLNKHIFFAKVLLLIVHVFMKVLSNQKLRRINYQIKSQSPKALQKLYHRILYQNIEEL